MHRFIRKIAAESRQKEFFWRYGFNLFPSLGYRPAISGEAAETKRHILQNLNRDGICISSIDELTEIKASFAEMESAVELLLEKRREELTRLKLQANDAEKIGAKTFNVELLGNTVEFEAESIYARFALKNIFLDIANAYFGMLVKLRYYNVWLTFATDSAARESQLWHYDREDNYILKIFVYLRDVDEGAGPFTYAPQTHRKGILAGKDPEFFLEKNVRRTNDEQMAAVVSCKDWIKGTGKKGTVIFADTRGYHKGGEARTSDRLMFTCMFTSPASESKRLLKFPEKVLPSSLTGKQISALEIN